MENRHYHFIGIGGIGMGAIAKLMLEKDCRVSGSDVKENSMTFQLKEKGAVVYKGHDAKNIKDADFVVISSAIKKDNCELVSAKARHIPILRRAQLLAYLMQEHIGITIAGAHGKTTTTSMISNMLVSAGLEPTSAIGGIINDSLTNARTGDGKYFIAEVDESDGSFMFFHPQYSVITNIDFEHVDHYGNWDNILKAYKDFIRNTQKNGVVIACGDDERLLALLKDSGIKFNTYGFSGHNEMRAANITITGMTLRFDCFLNDSLLGQVGLNVPGKHNVLNSMACIFAGTKLSIDFGIIAQSLRNFKGVKRRFQYLGTVNDITVIDDYAHHPTELRSTIEAARQVNKGRLVAVFQPHRYSRMKFLMSEFAEALSSVDILFVTDIYAASEEPIEGSGLDKFIEKVKENTDIPVYYVKKEEAVDRLVTFAEPDDLILTLGAGDVTNIGHSLVEKMQLLNIMR